MNRNLKSSGKKLLMLKLIFRQTSDKLDIILSVELWLMKKDF